ncbi:MAG: Rossmann-like and DUF2520 domain-containing protein [Bryobacteraceae bacterium]|jgi:predicted short-subunit dehydrogenase-like oxidoreductase (DUF2520 family)
MTHSTETAGNDAIGIAGTGRVAQALAALLRRNGAAGIVVAGRRSGAIALRELPRRARRILIAVADDAIGEVAGELAAGGLRDGIALHTCGSAGPEALAALRASGNSIGVLHPLQTVPTPERGVETLAGAVFACAGDARAVAWARALIAQLGGKPLAIDPLHWQRYHAAAVMASNYHAALVDAALELMEDAGIRRGPALEALAPLIRAATDNVLALGPEAALTGPIRRGDVGAVQRNLQALEDATPETRNLYVSAGLRTLALARRAGLSDGAARRIEAALEGSSS